MTTESVPRRIRISLRLTMAMIVVLGLWMGWLVNKTRKEREAVAAVKSNGGMARYDCENFNGIYGKPRNLQPFGPIWLRKILGDDYFLTVGYVNFSDSPRTGLRSSAEDDLSFLMKLSGLTVLFLRGTQATEQGLGYVSALHGLEELHIQDARLLTDSVAKQLGGMRNLKRLFINKSQMTDDGLKHLGKINKLEVLMLHTNDFSDDGLAHLKGLRNLRHLAITRCEVTDRGIDHLLALSKLRIIALNGTAVTDDGVLRLKAAMPNLKVHR